MKIRDIIDIEIRRYRLHNMLMPSYIVINRDAYFTLKEEVGYSFDQEITLFAGCDMLVTMDLKMEINVM
tara:strand:+ start:161 stop:367 length:207 start_codon:yes stop_codon:yes gene_type:complete